MTIQRTGQATGQFLHSNKIGQMVAVAISSVKGGDQIMVV